jgi:hypothetical protein
VVELADIAMLDDIAELEGVAELELDDGCDE